MKKLLFLLIIGLAGYYYFHDEKPKPKNAYEFKYDSHDYIYYRGEPYAVHVSNCFYCKKCKYIYKFKSIKNKIKEYVLDELPEKIQVEKYHEKILPPSYAIGVKDEKKTANFDTYRTSKEEAYETIVNLIEKIDNALK